MNRKVAGLRRYTADVTECAWPNCDKSTPESFAATRVGVLCVDHAWSHYDAMHDYLTWPTIEETATVFQLRCRQVELDAPTSAEIAVAKANEEDAKNYGAVYYLRVGDQIKIGFSTDVKRRLRAYPPGSELLAVEEGYKKQERIRHLQFAEYLAAGREWFHPSDELMLHIRTLVDMHGHPGEYEHKYRELRRAQDTKQPMKYVRANKYR